MVEIEAALWRLIRRSGFDLQEGLALMARLEIPPSSPRKTLARMRKLRQEGWKACDVRPTKWRQIPNVS